MPFVHILSSTLSYEELCFRILENERELRQKFEDMVEQFAQQHSSLEAQMRREYHLSDPSSSAANKSGASNSSVGGLSAAAVAAGLAQAGAGAGSLQTGASTHMGMGGAGAEVAKSLTSNSGSGGSAKIKVPSANSIKILFCLR